jgi:predicted dehydrogenase
LSRADLQKPGVQWRINPAVSGGGLFHDLAPHQLDLLLWWFGDAENCSGYATNHAGLYSADDTVLASFRFKSDMALLGFWHFAAPADAQEDYILIEGTDGSIRCSVFWEDDIELKNASGSFRYSFEPPEHNQIFLIDQVVRFFRGEVENPCPVSEGLKGIRCMDAITNRHFG